MDPPQKRGRAEATTTQKSVEDFYKKPATLVNVEKMKQSATVPTSNYISPQKPQLYSFYNQPQPASTTGAGFKSLKTTPAKPAEHKKKTTCPEALKDFIKRAFAKCNSDEERTLMEKMTKEVVEKIKVKGNIHKEHWETMPLPLLPREKEVAVFNNPAHSSFKAAQIMQSAKSADCPKTLETPYVIPRKQKEPPKPVPQAPAVPQAPQPSLLPQPRPPHGPPAPQSSQSHSSSYSTSNAHYRPFHESHSQPETKSDFAKDVPRSRPRTVARPPEPASYDDDDELERLAQAWKVVGTSTALEKRYLRLTDAPDPATVRPEPIIRKALAVFKEKWKRDEIGYSHLSDQLRAIRQDLKVQRIKNGLTVEVYQVHARLALEAGDLDQFISCMGSLFELFAEGLEGKKTEFLAYRIMYFALMQLNIQLEKCLKALPDKSCPEIQYALRVKTAVITGNYLQIFRLRQRGPHMTAYLLDIFVPRLRKAAIANMCQSYQPSVPLAYLRKTLDFVTDAECVDYLKQLGCVIDDTSVLCKESLDGLRESGVLVGSSS